ncbi:MAG: hypothetical protein QF757_02570, partial [Candidatus Marinimicrobia bacterium]|nr:hypothetical protein [Candidatus Neomarinimicrobiota bacterium]
MLRKSLKITFFNLTLAGALWAQAQVLDITSPTSGQSISTSDVTVSFTMAAYFAVDDSACTDCDGFVRAFLNDVQVASVNSTADFTISGVTDGSYMLTLEAVNPFGESFDPVIEDTVSFNVVGNPSLCPPSNLTVISGDTRNYLSWSMSGTQQPGEWNYLHDGTFENAFSSVAGGAGLAQLFEPTSYPATIQEVRFHVSEFGSPTQNVEVTVFADDGFTVLSGPYIVSGISNDWIEIDIDDATIESGGFLVATYNVLSGGPYISVDDSFYNGTLYFGNSTDGWT